MINIPNYIKSPINYIGNKYKLISQIEPLFPRNIDTFVDVCGGSGTVLINTNANYYLYNDINPYVASIFNGLIRNRVEYIISEIEKIIDEYELSMTNKAGFEKLRDDYNNGKNDWITLYTLMCHSFNHQFRFNSKHQYNSSFGKNRSYFSDRQRKDLYDFKERFKDKKVKVLSGSFTQIDYLDLGSNDLVYFDPPYLNSVGNYNDGKRGFEGWTEQHEAGLLNTLLALNEQRIKFALSNNLKYENPILNEWLDNNKKMFNVYYLNGDYINCNYHKIDRSKDIEVLITNY